MSARNIQGLLVLVLFQQRAGLEGVLPRRRVHRRERLAEARELLPVPVLLGAPRGHVRRVAELGGRLLPRGHDERGSRRVVMENGRAVVRGLLALGDDAREKLRHVLRARHLRGGELRLREERRAGGGGGDALRCARGRRERGAGRRGPVVPRRLACADPQEPHRRDERPSLRRLHSRPPTCGSLSVRYQPLRSIAPRQALLSSCSRAPGYAPLPPTRFSRRRRPSPSAEALCRKPRTRRPRRSPARARGRGPRARASRGARS